MKKLLKILAVLAVIVAVLVMISSLLLHVLLPPEKAKALVLKQLTTHLKREVRIGEVSVGVVSGLSVSDLKVSEAPNFSKGTFVSSDQFTVKVALLPLLFRKVVVDQLILRHPVINVVRSPDGKTFNFSDLTSPAQAPSPLVGEGRPGTDSPIKPGQPLQAVGRGRDGGKAVKANPPPPSSPTRGEEVPSKNTEPSLSLLVSHAEISKGVIHFVDHSPAKQSADIDPLNLKLKNVSLISPFTIQCSLHAVSRGLAADLDLVGEIELAAGSFKFKSCSLSSGGSKITLSGKATNLKTGSPVADLKLEMKEFNPATLKTFMPLPPALHMAGPIVGEATLKGDQKLMDLGVQADLTNTNLAYDGQFSKPVKTPLNVSLQAGVENLQNAQIKDLSIVLSSLKVAGHGAIQGVTSTQPSVSLHLETNTFPLADLQHLAPGAFPKDIRLGGSAKLAADISGTTVSSSIKAKFEGQDMSVAMADKFNKPAGTPMQFSIIGELLQPSASQQTFTFQSLAGTLGPIQLSGSGSYKAVGKAGQISVSLKTNAWLVQEAAKMVPMLAAYQPAGKVSMDVHASGSPAAPIANGVLNLQDVSARYNQSQLSQITSAVAFTQQDVSIPKLTGKLDGADLSLKLTGHRLTTQPEVTVESSIAVLDLTKILPPLPAAPAALAPRLDNPWVLIPFAMAAEPPAPLPPLKTSGHLTVGKIKHELYQASNLDFKWNLADVTPDLSRVSGSANLRQGKGVIQNVEKLANTSKAIRIAFYPLITLQKLDKNGLLQTLHLPTLQSVPFDSIKGDYTLKSGLMTIQTFELAGKDLSIQTHGTAVLSGDQLLDLRVIMKLAAGLAIPFSVTGPAAHPSVKPDLQDIGKQVIQQAGQQFLKNLGLGGNPPSNVPSDGKAPPDQNQNPDQQNPVDQLQKTFKNIFH